MHHREERHTSSASDALQAREASSNALPVTIFLIFFFILSYDIWLP